MSPPPRDHSHSHIKKGLKQCKDREVSYFVWTNGDCWQFFSLTLTNAPFYQVILSEPGEVESIVNKLRIIEKERFTANPESFDEAIRENWKTKALPDAWKVLFEKDSNDLLQLVRKHLPTELDMKNEEIEKFNEKILRFLNTLEGGVVPPPPPPPPPPDWEQLLNDPDYEKTRERFRKDYYRKFGNYLISEKYEPWKKTPTWFHVGAPKEGNERKKLGPVIAFFMEWRFIEKAGGADMYQRVEDSVPYLKEHIEKPALR